MIAECTRCLLVGQLGGAWLICSVETHLHHYDENDDFFSATVACSLYLDSVSRFGYSNSRGSVSAVDGGSNAGRGSPSTPPVQVHRADTPCDGCLSMDGTDAGYVSPPIEMWMECLLHENAELPLVVYCSGLWVAPHDVFRLLSFCFCHLCSSCV